MCYMYLCQKHTGSVNKHVKNTIPVTKLCNSYLVLGTKKVYIFEFQRHLDIDVIILFFHLLHMIIHKILRSIIMYGFLFVESLEEYSQNIILE